MKISVLVIATVLLSTVFSACGQNIVQVNSTDVNSMIQKDKNWVVLDVRTADEFNQGHIKGAINIDIRQPDALSKIDKLDHNAKYIVHCRTNHRSKIAVDHMSESGFKTIYQMTDGITGWNQNGLPVVN